MMAEFTKRREFVVDGLNKLPGVSCIVPNGAFYAFPNVKGTGPRHARAGQPPARRGRRRAALGHGVRRVRRGLPARLLRELAREHRGGAAEDGRPARADGRLMAGAHRRHGPRARAGARAAARGRRARRAHAGDGAPGRGAARGDRGRGRRGHAAQRPRRRRLPGRRRARSCASSRTSPWATTTSTSPPAPRRGVLVTNTPGVLTDATADIAMALILMVMRRLGEGERVIRSRTGWRWHMHYMLGTEPAGQDARHRRPRPDRHGHRAPGARVRHGDHLQRPAARRRGAGGRARSRASSASTICSATSDVVSLHCPLTPETHHLITRRAPGARCAATPTSSTRRAGPSSTRPRSPRRCAAA